MFFARLIQNDGTEKRLRADLYDPAQHAGMLKCADPKCCAEMRFQSARMVEGVYDRRAHFVSKNTDQHRKNCEAWDPLEADKQRQSRESLQDALQNNHDILIHLNAPAGQWGVKNTTIFRKAVERLTAQENRQSIGLEFYKATHQGKYAAFSVRSVEEYVTLKADITALKPRGYTGRIKISFAGMLMPVGAFILHGKDVQTRHNRAFRQFFGMLSNKQVAYEDIAELKSGNNISGKRVHGFVGLAHLRATERSRQNKGGHMVRSRVAEMSADDYKAWLAAEGLVPDHSFKVPGQSECTRVVLLHKFYFSGEAARACADQAREVKAATVIAAPYMPAKERERALDLNIHTNGTKFVEVCFRVVNGNQFLAHETANTTPKAAPRRAAAAQPQSVLTFR